MRHVTEEGGAVHVFADASVKPEITGIGLAVKDANGRLILWLGKRDKPMTCNEAEYCALIFALEQATHYPRICFSHVPREQNELADAMAEDACHPWKNACHPCRSGHVCSG